LPNLPEEFEYPTRKYAAMPLSNIFCSYHGWIFIAEGRFVFYTEPTRPETLRKVNNIPLPDDITAISRDDNHVYVHTYSITKVLTGRNPKEMFETIYPIGAIKQHPIYPPDRDVPFPTWMSPKGWARGLDGHVGYLNPEERSDRPSFYKLDLPPTAEAYLGFNPLTREIICNVTQ
jgi:hypothetical protein